MKSSWVFVAAALSLGACDKIPGFGGDDKKEETKVASAETKTEDKKAEEPKADDKKAEEPKAEGGEAAADAGAADAGAAEAGAAEGGTGGSGGEPAGGSGGEPAGGSGGEPAGGSGGEAAEGGEPAADGGEAPAADPIIRSYKPPVGFFAAWAKKDATFTITEAMAGEDKLEAKVTKLDIVGGVTVARITWTTIRGEERSEEAGPFNMMLLWDDEARIIFGQPEISDDEVAKWVKEPMSYDGMPKEGDPMFEALPPVLEGSGLVCLVDDQSQEGVECDDVCFGTVCFSETNGLESLEGLMAPDRGAWNLSAGNKEPEEPEEPTEPEVEEPTVEEPKDPGKPSTKKPSTKKPSTKKPEPPPPPGKRPVKRPIKK